MVATVSLPTGFNGGTTEGMGVGVIVGVVVTSSLHAGRTLTRDSSIATIISSIKIFFTLLTSRLFIALFLLEL